MKKFISIILLFVYTTITTFAAAEPQLPVAPQPWPGEPDLGAAVSPMRKGDAALFTGVLLSPKAVATVIAEMKLLNEKIMLEVNKAKSEEGARCAFSLKEAELKAQTDRSVLQAKLESKDRQVKVLEDRLQKTENDKPDLMLWVGGSFAAGLIVSIATTFALTQAKQ